MKESIQRATELSKKAKDVRDELNILRTIARFQLTVQRRLAATSATKNEDLTAQYNLDDINELDKLASRIQENVRVDPSLPPNLIGFDSRLICT